MTRTTVQQHYFTREREGVFRSNEGFDTIAKSAGLEPGFIKGTLHPYCAYKPPKELSERGEADASRYPESLVVFHADGGELVIGRSVYVPADFTGQRSAFFTHQYVIPEAGKETYIREPERLLRAGGFQNRYDISRGKELPELQEVPYEHTFAAGERDALLTRLGVDRDRFQQLVYAAMSSVGGKRQVYIVLNCDVSEYALEARRLMELIYSCLPYAIRRQLGFMTVHGEPEGKQKIHVMFVAKGSLRTQDRNSSFDFAGSRFVHTDLSGAEQVYLDFVWENRNDPLQLTDLFEFCDEALVGTDAKERLKPSIYEQLAVLFEIEQGNRLLYESDPAGRLAMLLSFLSADTINRQSRLNELFLRLMEKESAASVRSLPTPELVLALMQYGKVAGDDAKPQLLRCLAGFAHRVTAASRQDFGQAAWIYETLLTDADVFASVIHEVFRVSADEAEAYASYRIAKADSIKAAVDEIGFWRKHDEYMLGSETLAKAMTSKLGRLVKTNRAGRLEAAAILHHDLQRLSEREGSDAVSDLCLIVSRELQADLLEQFRLMELSGVKELATLGFMLDPVDIVWRSGLHAGARQLLDEWSALYKVLELGSGTASQARQLLQGMGPVELDRMQESAKRLFAERLEPEYYPIVPHLFYTPPFSAASKYDAEYDYFRMLSFIGEHAKEAVYDYLVWSLDDSRFVESNGQLNLNYRAAIDRYFERLDKQAVKNKPVMKRLLHTNNGAFNALMHSIKVRQSGSLTRWYYRNRKKLMLAGSVLIPLVLLCIAFWTPISLGLLRIGPAPALQVAAIPEMSDSATVHVSASAKNGNPAVQIYLNGQLAGSGKIETEVTLHEGANVVELYAVNRGGKASKPIRKNIEYTIPAPALTITDVPESVKASSVTVKVSATDRNDPQPKIYVNGELAGQGSVSKSVALKQGDNMIEVKAVNKDGKSSQQLVKTTRVN
ncbi:hypothetical protein PAESOLCIP111_05004 [Paenibacillus solanacearum]|uniref:Cadherin-like beta sandwich domain-containing protein n=1 Tax=Paenibacillus solanacearum TaxID=2048548 RepID=A0A916K8R9_9BACL|nr:cadherin-like beta sandwich domain-containing protein [Paenibacillus solanacearum]CAG7645714.1 hypothetical protein PAESOLCIP111_05004 [Paenibacillus solanacearum]